MYANNEPTVKPVVYDKVMIFPEKIQNDYKKLVIIDKLELIIIK